MLNLASIKDIHGIHLHKGPYSSLSSLFRIAFRHYNILQNQTLPVKSSALKRKENTITLYL